MTKSEETGATRPGSTLETLPALGSAARRGSRAASTWQRLRTQLHYLRTFVRPDVMLFEGRTKAGNPLRMLRAGISDRQTAYFLASQVFAERPAERPVGPTWLWMLPALARRHGCAFVLFRVSRRRATIARRILRRSEDNAMHLPVFVGTSVDISDETRLMRSHSLRDDVRRIRKIGFRSSLSRSRQDLEAFVREYRNPHVNSVHGFGALGMDFQPLLASCSQDRIPEPWILLKVELGGQWVAGGLLVDEPGRAALMEIGVRDADPALVRGGALQAAYWLTVEHLREQKHRRVNLMHTPPFLSSGVLQYKLKFGPRLKVARPNDGFLLLFDRDNEVARETLLREPLLVSKGSDLRAVWFALDSETPPDRSRIPVDRLTHAGIDDIERVVLRH